MEDYPEMEMGSITLTSTNNMPDAHSSCSAT